MAGMPGFEPGMTVLETVVIPFHYIPIVIILAWSKTKKRKGLLELGGFFVGSGLAALGAVFLEFQFIRRIELVFLN